jgi:hypothetical protein
VNARLKAAGSDTHYEPEVSGGRTRPDGVEIKWELSTPARWGEKMGASRLPFLCGDITPRELRVRVPNSPSGYLSSQSLPLLGADAARVNNGAPERRAWYRALASARPAEHIHGSLC